MARFLDSLGSALLVLTAIGCSTGTAPSGPTPTPTPDTSKGELSWVGPFSVVEGECSQYSVQVVDKAGDPAPVSGDTVIELAAGDNGAFFSDSNCTTGLSDLTIPGGNASESVYVQFDAPGRFDLSATDPSTQIATGRLNVSVDAMLLASQALSQYSSTFNNAAWTTVETSIGVPMTAVVRVPETGDWFIEVRARVNVREPNGAVWSARLRQNVAGSGTTVDYDVINGNENEETADFLFYVENSPLRGETYTYTVELAGTGGTFTYNPQNFTIGPAGDQLTGGTSQVLAIVRPARHSVD